MKSSEGRPLCPLQNVKSNNTLFEPDGEGTQREADKAAISPSNGFSNLQRPNRGLAHTPGQAFTFVDVFLSLLTEIMRHELRERQIKMIKFDGEAMTFKPML